MVLELAMVVARILGIGDLIAASMIILSSFLSPPITLLGAKWLILKGGIFAFAGNMASFIDVLCGIYVIFLAYGWSSTFLNVITFIWIAQKGLASLL